MPNRRNRKGRRYRLKALEKIDGRFLFALMILIGFGLLMVFSASMYSSTVENGGNGYSLFLKQAVSALIGLFIMFAGSRVDYRKYNNIKLAGFLLGLSILLLIAVFFIGVDSNGAKRWLSLGVTTFQPSELAKFAGILYLSCLVSKDKEVRTKFWPFIVKGILPMAVICGLTAFEPSMSAALAIAVGMMFVLFLSGTDWKFFVPIILLGIIAVAALLIKEPWRLERLNVYLGNGGMDWQITQSLLAIGSGGIFGQGLGNGRQKFLYLPELQNDFIFANVGEELGLVGCVLLIALYFYIIYRGFKIATSSKDLFGYVYTASVMALMGFQVVINIAVATALLPVTGIALPFVSAGGSSVIVWFMMMAPILNLSRGMEEKEIQ